MNEIRLDIGDYQGTVQRHRLVALGQKATPAVELEIRIESENEGVFALIFLTEKSMGIARQQLKACGFDPDREDVEVLDAVPNFLRGKPCPVRIVEDDWGGKLRKKAEIPTPGGAGKVTKDKARSLTKALRAAASEESKAKTAEKKSPARAAPPAWRAPQPEPTPMDFDDIPFGWLLPLLAVIGLA